jgi:uncharacterized DUF497 family protein
MAARAAATEASPEDWQRVYTYVYSMHFEWDEPKSQANLERRGFDFAFATLIFDGVTVEKEDTRGDYGERRVVAIGPADGILLTIVYTDRKDPVGRVIRRVISARRSSRHERERYSRSAKTN